MTRLELTVVTAGIVTIASSEAAAVAALKNLATVRLQVRPGRARAKRIESCANR
jgi:hypothetical protein